MDIAKTLLRSVMRAFYETKFTLIIDALCIHGALRDDELGDLMGVVSKDLHKLCGKLKEDRCLAVHTRSEIKEGQTRPSNRIYYYIDYRQSIDAIKWRVYKIDKDMQGKTIPASERKEYFCERCKAEWTQMEVLDNVSDLGFLCHTCNYPLKHDAERQSGGHKQSTRMNQQFKFITDLLPQIDAVVVPDNTFENAFNTRVVPTPKLGKQLVASVGVDEMNRPTAVKGMANTGPTHIDVKVSASTGPTEEEIAAERARKEQVAQQNVMPSWITKSTVSGDSFRAESATAIKQENGVNSKGAAAKKDADGKEDAALDDYFAKLKAQTEEEEKRRAAAQAEESSDEEDEEFEDVPSTGTSARGTPALGVASTAPVVPSPLRQSSLKREGSSNGNSPGGTSGSDGRPAKKVKVEEPAPPAPANDDDDDSEDDIEFENI